VTVTSASGIHATQIANYCMMMILAFQFDLPSMIAYQRQSTWPKRQYEAFRPVDLSEKTVGIVGYGSIGRELARLANSFGMTVLASKRNLKRVQESDTDYSEGEGDPEGVIPERIYPSEALATMASDSDFLVVTPPLTDKTRHMVNADVFKAMKETSVVINIGRGAVIDEQAMITALKEGQIAGAGLDVFEEEPLPEDSPLWQMENVLISPHISGNSASYNEKATRLFVANLERYLQKKPLYNVVNLETGY
jgi:phosphoglycerate dehydrogenase-like enzyme